MARGATACSISPIWERHLLDAGDPPRVTFHHHEYDEVEPPPPLGHWITWFNVLFSLALLKFQLFVVSSHSTFVIAPPSSNS